MTQKHVWQLAPVLALAVAAHAQTSRGAVTGTIIDASGAIVPKARATLVATRTGLQWSTLSNQAGIYRFEAVDPGIYELRVTHPGFRRFLSTGIGVEANRVSTIDPRLELGPSETAIEVSGESSEMLVKDSPLRGGNFLPNEVTDLPLVSLNPISLARTLPGVIQPSGSMLWGGGGEATQFSVNGQRPRANNYLLDGTENNGINFTGVAQPFNMADAVEEVSAQTSNFSVEFGRAGGGVFNLVTRSGTNSLHGTLLWRYQSQRFNSVSNLDKLNGISKQVFSDNVYGLTIGGPVRTNKTFFFAGFQQDTRHGTGNFPLTVPTAAAISRLRSLFPSNPRLDLYLDLLGDLRGSGAPIPVALGLDPQTGVERASVQFAPARYMLPTINEGPQWLIRFDHYRSEAHRMSLRYIYDSRIDSPSPQFPGDTQKRVFFPNFILDRAARNQNFLFTDSYTFGPGYTNEFRFSYGRLDADDPNRISPLSAPLALTLPRINIINIDSPGIPWGFAQFVYANNFLFQDTQTKVSGRHTFRFGVEFLRQLAVQNAGANTNGDYNYLNAPGFSAFANFLDDFSGASGRTSRTFGADVFHPDQFRQSYFLQDNWKATQTLVVTLGLRYENFGQPANTLRYPAFSGFDPARFLEPNTLNRDDNNFGPAFGLAWSPSRQSGWLGKLLGEHNTVWRGGYQISYDGFFTQMIALGLATSTPNAVTSVVSALNAGRGSPNWSAQLPAFAAAPSLLDAQNGVIEKNFRSPYTERWSFGVERQLLDKVLLDVSYVGSESHKLSAWADLNPRLLNGQYLHPGFGQRWVRTSQGNSAYHALQLRLDRRFAEGFHLAASYTWSRNIDDAAEGGAHVNSQSSPNNMPSMPEAQGGLTLDRGLSDYDRAHRLTVACIWEIPGPRRGWWRYAFGGWSVAGISSFQSGTPFTALNGSDRNNDTIANNDRPDIGNPNASLNSRAVIAPASGPMQCATGYRNPDSGVCVTPGDVHWIEGRGLPNGSTVGRNTLLTGGTINFDARLAKSFLVAERKRLEFRWEALNAFNHPQFTQVPERSVVVSPAPRFLNRDFTNSGIRTMWAQIKLIF